MDKERQRLINEAARILNNIEQLFLDQEYWNELHPEETPLDYDGDGELSQWKRYYEAMLKSEADKGNFPSVVPMKARRRRFIPIQPKLGKPNFG
jgi:hypothetical protein